MDSNPIGAVFYTDRFRAHRFVVGDYYSLDGVSLVVKEVILEPQFGAMVHLVVQNRPIDTAPKQAFFAVA